MLCNLLKWRDFSAFYTEWRKIKFAESCLFVDDNKNSDFRLFYVINLFNITKSIPLFPVRIVANQTTGHNYYKGILMQARRVICASNETMEGKTCDHDITD